MTKIIKRILFCLAVGSLTNCSQVLQTVTLDINSEDSSTQQEFNVIEKTLTVKEAKRQNNTPYQRTVVQNGRGAEARTIPEKLALLSNFPNNNDQNLYKIGIGDTITFSRLIENNRPAKKIENDWPLQKAASNYKLGIGDTLALTIIRELNSLNQTSPRNSGNNENGQNLIIRSQQVDDKIESTGRIGSDGSVLLLEVGRLDAKNKSLNELRSEVRNILIRNGVIPRFQLEIVQFKSQKSYLTVNSSSTVIILDDQRTRMRDVLTSANVGFKPGVITRIRLQRDGKEYSILLRDIYIENKNNIDVQSGDHIFVEDSSAEIISTSSTVDHEGHVVFETIGKIKAAGRTLEELNVQIKNLMQHVPDSQNAFQIQITDFFSQQALLSIPKKLGILIPITDSPITILEVLTKNGVSVDGQNITRISLQRNGRTYVFPLYELLNPNSPRIYLRPNDRITAEILPYKQDKVFVLGGVSAQIFEINPANRETLADVLFTSGGALSDSSAKRSEVYLLRGNNPVMAYHLDAQSPTRLIVADAMELRPNDIIFVAEQSLISFNRTLATIVPLRILLRDIQDENIP